jgi:hypothetical protein
MILGNLKIKYKSCGGRWIKHIIELDDKGRILRFLPL